MTGRFASTQADPQWVSNMKQPFELILVVIVLAVSTGASYAEPKKHHFVAAAARGTDPINYNNQTKAIASAGTLALALAGTMAGRTSAGNEL